MNMEQYREDIIRDISRLVRIPSVFEEGSPYPYGEGVNRCLDEALALMSELGFKVFRSPEGQYGYAEVGQGELFGVLGHLDVVNAREADGWKHPPFDPVLEDGILYGRGTQDDKGPMIAAVYGLKALMDEGWALSKRVRFIFGLDEETLWRSIAKYTEKEEAPVMGFTPDSSFPLTYAEKGLLQVKMHSKEPAKISYKGGDSFNAVSAYCNCDDKKEIADALKALGYSFKQTGGVISTEGKTAHAMNPWKGVNANIMLMEGLKKAGYGDKAIDFVVDCFKDKFKFEGFSDKDLSDFSGPVTVNLGKVEASPSGTVLSVDLRLPVGVKKEDILKILSERASKYNMTVEEYDWLGPIHLPLESPFIQHLLAAYRAITADKESQPKISSGATYARAFDNCVAFGANFPTSPTTEHQPNECTEISRVLEAAEIYREAFLRLVVERK